MSRPKYTSVLAEQICKFLDYRENSGIKYLYPDYVNLLKLDAFFIQERIVEISFSKEQAIKWKQPLDSESKRAQYERINVTKRFFEYLFVQGFPVFQFNNIKYPKQKFTPHIYNDDEIDRYFAALDRYDSLQNRRHKIQLPILFRIMLCCGTRMTETITIQKKDIDIENGIIRLSETKNSKERYVLMSDSLKILIKDFANKTFYALKDDDYIFTSLYGKHISASTVARVHHDILSLAGIPNTGSGRYGKRVHDWRHTFAVRSFKQLIDMGMDMYAALPILSVYLGHNDIYATERYLRLTINMYPYISEKFKAELDKLFEK